MKYNPKEPKRDCFAFLQKTFFRDGEQITGELCSALNSLVCVKEDCPFFKEDAQWRKELILNHGTDSLKHILLEYQEKKQEGCEEDEQWNME